MKIKDIRNEFSSTQAMLRPPFEVEQADPAIGDILHININGEVWYDFDLIGCVELNEDAETHVFAIERGNHMFDNHVVFQLLHVKDFAPIAELLKDYEMFLDEYSDWNDKYGSNECIIEEEPPEPYWDSEYKMVDYY